MPQFTRIFLLLIFVFSHKIFVFSQNIPIGTWRTHAAYLPAKKVAESPKYIFCATENGLFYLDKEENTLETWSKIDRLSEVNIEAMAFHAPTNTLVLGYQNGNIDLVTFRGVLLDILNINTIKNARLTGSKRINHVLFHQNIAYLSTDFGMVVIDLERRNLRDTYQNLGANGETIAVFGATLSRDSILIATEKGVRIAAFNANINLKDFNQWRRAGNSLTNQVFRHIVSRNNVVYASLNGTQLLKYSHQTTWQNVNIGTSPQIKSLRQVANSVIIANQNVVQFLDLSDNVSNISHSLLVNPQDATLQDNTLWIADGQNGLVKREAGNDFVQYVPNGVARQAVARLLANGQEIIATSGGLNHAGQRLNNNAGFYVFDNATWTNFNAYDTRNAKPIPDIKDCFSIAYNPNDQSLYIGSLGDGLLIRKPNGTFERINGNPFQPNANNEIRIVGMAFEPRVGLWIATANMGNNQPSLYLRKPDGTWQTYTFASPAERNPLDLIVARNGVKWLPLNSQAGGGILVFDEKTNRSRVLNTSFNQGSLPTNNVNCLAQDLEGQIWVGTDRGIAIFFNPSRAFENIDAGLPIFEARPLLRAEVVTCIAIDGGNRKWIGTNNGLWLFNSTGSQLVHHFNEENSPLPSNQILSLALNQTTGEVFIATSKGIVSYRSDATQGFEVNTDVKVFPNPVYPDFSGVVAIAGLVENAVVKITDINGQLIYQTRAQGGTATWNVQDYNGRRAKSGVYLIFSATEDGKEALVSKVAVLE
ncbi:MAG: T9SS type A sorting domain-containing protein [Microscillaceae bacterium]|nr:T9SS type A sorting domain-containing protein [Microscillaceae bacterium]MDW8461280.1 T9SS type A sorting domain-containing protein [Cytophagales bacterium]